MSLDRFDNIDLLAMDDPGRARAELDLIAKATLAPLDEARVLKIRGTLERLSGNLKAARKQYARARSILEELRFDGSDKLIRQSAREDTDIERRLSVLAADEGNLEEALEHSKNVERASAMVGSKKLMARSWSMRGVVYLYFEKAKDALFWFRRALPILKDHAIEGPALSYNIHTCLHLVELEPEEADDLQAEIAKARLTLRVQDKDWKHQRIGVTKNTLSDGRIRLVQGYLSLLNLQYEEAEVFLSDAKDVFSKHESRMDEAISNLYLAECAIFFEKWYLVHALATDTLDLLKGQDLPETRKALKLLGIFGRKRKKRECQKQVGEARVVLLGRK